MPMTTQVTLNLKDFEHGWSIMQEGIQKLINILEGIPNNFTSDEYMQYYTVVYELCSSKASEPSQKFYDKYKETFQEYITSKVLPSLREKKDEEFVREIVKRWSNHKVMVRWLSRFFHYLDRYYLDREKLPSTEEVGFMTFFDMVYLGMKDQLRLELISMINREREGEKIDQNLLKNALDIYVEMGRGSLKHYENDMEEAMLENVTAYYSQKASSWIMVDSYEDYMLKAKECMEQEKDRVACYLPSSSQKKLLEIVDRELLSSYTSRLQEMKQISSFDIEANQ
ncbi:cullin-1-like [Thalictrum thalictroides]|uniref:Cullin-1-like n=1 Tax=Thalictrum thalictroides TaxID=46969 RepID=A0A7J6XFC4_THATH|nr:cullin-1-like [Thalictrum thalictroides]